jgi:hypothetical protein
MGTTFANLHWNPARDIHHLLSEYPLVGMGKDAVPMLLGAFKGPYQAKLCHDTLQGIEAQGVFDNETDVGLRLADELRAAYQAGREKFRAALINTYTQNTFLYKRANWVLRYASVRPKPDNFDEIAQNMWPYISLLQMSLIRANPKVGGGTL